MKVDLFGFVPGGGGRWLVRDRGDAARSKNGRWRMTSLDVPGSKSVQRVRREKDRSGSGTSWVRKPAAEGLPRGTSSAGFRTGVEPHLEILGEIDGADAKLQGKPSDSQRNLESSGVKLESSSEKDRRKRNSLMEKVGKAEGVESAHKIFNSSLERGCGPDRMSFAILMKLANDCKDFNSVQKFFGDMQNLGIRPDIFCINLQMNALCMTERYLEAESLYHESLDENSYFQANIWTFALMARCSVLSGRTGTIRPLLQNMRMRDVPESTLLYNTLIDAFSRVNKPHVAKKVYQRMLDVNIRPDNYTYTSVLKLYIRERDDEGLNELFHGMKRLGIAPTTELYNTLINLLGSNGSVSTIERVLMSMKRTSVSLNARTYSSVLRAYGKGGDGEGARRFFFRMLQEGVPMNSYILSSAIHASSTCANPLLLDDVIGSLDVVKSSAATIVYNALLKAHIRVSDCAGAERVIERMALAHIKLDIFSYNTIIYGYAAVGNAEKTLEWLQRMLSRNVIPDAHTVNAILNVISADVPDRSEFYSDQLLQNFSRAPSVEMLTTIINILAKNGLVSKANELLNFMESDKSKVKPNVHTYSSIMNGFVKAGEVSSAWHVYEKMLSRGVRPTVWVYHILFVGFRKQNLEERMDRVLLEMKNHEIAPDEVMLCDLLEFYIGRKHFAEVVRILENLKAERTRPHGRMFSSFISMALKWETYDLARDLGREAARLRCKLYPSVVNQLVDLSQSARDPATVGIESADFAIQSKAETGVSLGARRNENSVELGNASDLQTSDSKLSNMLEELIQLTRLRL